MPNGIPSPYTRIEEYIAAAFDEFKTSHLVQSLDRYSEWVISKKLHATVLRIIQRVFRTKGKTVTHPWQSSNLPSLFITLHVRCIWNYVCEVTQCIFWEIFGSFLSKLLTIDRAFHLKSLSLYENRITHVRVMPYLCILFFCGLF